MAKKAHITSRPGVPVGERAIALCDKEFKVKVLWDDVPADKPVCRDCIEVALKALSEADNVIVQSRRFVNRLSSLTYSTSEILDPDLGLFLDAITERREDFEDRQRNAREERESADRAKQTCTCTWTSPEMMEEDPNCPIHGGEVPVAPELERESND